MSITVFIFLSVTLVFYFIKNLNFLKFCVCLSVNKNRVMFSSVWVQKFRTSRTLFLMVVSAALLLDTILNTVTIPIIPNYLYDLDHPGNGTLKLPTDNHSAPLPNITTQPLNNNQSINVETNKTNITSDSFLSKEQEKHNYLIKETIPVGILFASKCIAQLLFNPFAGILADRIGYTVIIFTGFTILFFSTIIFAFAASYTVLFISRCLQGIGSSCTSVSSLGMLAERFREDKERSSAIGIAFGGLALGAIIGPTFGGFMYDFVGKSSPFLVLSAVILLIAMLQMAVLSPKNNNKELEKPSFLALITDPYVLLATGALVVPCTGVSLLQATLPIWMRDTMGVSTWQQGAIFLPLSILYFISSILFGFIGSSTSSFRWLLTLICLAIIGISSLGIPFCTNIYYLLIPLGVVGLALAVVECSMVSELARIVDTRYTSVYGVVFAIGDLAFCIAYSVGPLISGILVNTIGFQWMIIASAILNMLYAPLMVVLRNPPSKLEQETSSSQGTYKKSSENL